MRSGLGVIYASAIEVTRAKFSQPERRRIRLAGGAYVSPGAIELGFELLVAGETGVIRRIVVWRIEQPVGRILHRPRQGTRMIEGPRLLVKGLETRI